MRDYPTIEACVGNPPLVRLQRMGAETGNTLLLKLEGNNPAGSVKDRPAMSMIQQVLQQATALTSGIPTPAVPVPASAPAAGSGPGPPCPNR